MLSYHADKPVIAGVTPTAVGVTFTGDLDGNLLVFDSTSGALVHRARTGGALAGGVVTSEIAGRQYVAFTWGNLSRTAFGALGVPSVVVMALKTGRADVADGNGKVYAQICVSCHGADGGAVAGHALSAHMRNHEALATVACIKALRPPMPKLFPDLLNEQDVRDVATYLRAEFALAALRHPRARLRHWVGRRNIARVCSGLQTGRQPRWRKREHVRSRLHR